MIAVRWKSKHVKVGRRTHPQSVIAALCIVTMETVFDPFGSTHDNDDVISGVCMAEQVVILATLVGGAKIVSEAEVGNISI